MRYLTSFLNNIFYQGMEFFGKYYSVYRGYVVDNDDPDGLNRLLVKVPQVTGVKTHVKWAYPRNNFSGENYGIQVLPKKGDLVWVEFEYGKPAFPVWSHGYYSPKQKPSEFKSVTTYGFKSPGKQMIIIKDEDGKIYITGGSSEKLGEHEGLLKVIETTEQLNKIENKVNDWLLHYKGHIHIDPVSGQTGVMVQPNLGSPSMLPQPGNLELTDKDYIQNPTVQH